MRVGWMASLVAAVITTSAACVSRVSVEGAPCPCPEDGMSCCPTLRRCIRSGATCPTALAPSSRQTCQGDSDCPTDEVCQSWTVDGYPAGPRQCGRLCVDDYPCAGGEVCQLAPHDSRPLSDLRIVRLCAPAVPVAGCENQGCQGECSLRDIGSTYCDGTTVRGCFLATHPRCGVTCSALVVSECKQDGCIVHDGTAQCGTALTFGGPCNDLDCAKCGGEPGSFFCDGTDLVACVALSTAHVHCGQTCQCSQICMRQTVAACTSCTQGTTAPSCSLP